MTQRPWELFQEMGFTRIDTMRFAKDGKIYDLSDNKYAGYIDRALIEEIEERGLFVVPPAPKVILDPIQTLKVLATGAKMPCMMIKFDPATPFVELQKSAPYLQPLDDVLSSGRAYLLFNSQEEMEAALSVTLCDNVPIERSIYAVTCNASGEIESENT